MSFIGQIPLGPFIIGDGDSFAAPLGAFLIDSTDTYAAITYSAGALFFNPAADASSIKIYLTAAGILEAKTSAAAGDRLLTLVSGVRTAI